MKFFRKTSTAVVLTLLLVALCCVWGYSRAYEENSQAQSGNSTPYRPAGESNLNYYLSLIEDEADLFDLETSDSLAWANLDLNNSYGVTLALQTLESIPQGQTLDAYTLNHFSQLQLDPWDLLLVMETDTQDWYLAYGGSIAPKIEASQDLANLIRSHLDAQFFQEGSNEGILALVTEIHSWCANNLDLLDAQEGTAAPFFQSGDKVESITLGSILSGILFTLLANVWWIVLLLVVLTLADRYRLTQYLAKYPHDPDMAPPVLFRPILFWHGPGSKWYARMVAYAAESPFEEEDDYDFSGAEPNFGTTPGGPQGTGFQGDPQAAYQQDRAGSMGGLLHTFRGLLVSFGRTIRQFFGGGRRM